MNQHQNCKLCPLVLALGILSITGMASAQQAEPGMWDRLRDVVVQEDEKLQEVLKKQKRLNVEEESLQAQREQDYRLQAMHREAVLLSELNVAWIYDQLDHWDCRIAEQKVQEVKTRIEELAGFGERIEALCGGFGARQGRQQQVCARQRTELSQAVTELEGLGRRYAAACPAQAEKPSQQPIQSGGDQPWR